jgi:hypothetical protein
VVFTRPYFLLNTPTGVVVAVHEFRFRQMCHLPACPCRFRCSSVVGAYPQCCKRAVDAVMIILEKDATAPSAPVAISQH